MAVAVNPSYLPINGAISAYNGLAYIAEQSISRAWKTQYEQNYPFRRRVIQNGAKGQIERTGANSLKLIFPVWPGAMVLADVFGQARNAEGTAVGYATASDGTQAEIPLARYTGKALKFTRSELDFAKKQSALGRGNIVEARMTEQIDVLDQRFATDLYAGTTESDIKVLSINHATKTTATVHGIPQTDNNWASNVNAIGGPFDLEYFDRRLGVLREEKGSNPDMCILASSGGIDIYSKVKRLLGQDVMVMTGPQQGGTLKRGFETFIWSGVEFVRDHWATSGEVIILDTSTWVYAGEDGPMWERNLSPIDNMLAYESIMTMQCAVGCSSPRRNERWTGVTG